MIIHQEKIVLVTGSGWLPGETVTLNFVALPLQSVVNYYAVADSAGNISNNEYIIYDYHLDATIILTATGQTSGLTAMTMFTDHTDTTLVLENASGTYGGNVTLRARLTTSGGSGINGKTVEFYLNQDDADGSPDGTAVTQTVGGQSGWAECTLSLGSLGAGSHDIYAYFAGDTTYQNDGDGATLTIKADTTLIVSSATGIYGGNVNLTATLTKFRWFRRLMVRLLLFI